MKSSLALSISLSLNFVLLGLCAWLLTPAKNPRQARSAATTSPLPVMVTDVSAGASDPAWAAFAEKPATPAPSKIRLKPNPAARNAATRDEDAPESTPIRSTAADGAPRPPLAEATAPEPNSPVLGALPSASNRVETLTGVPASRSAFAIVGNLQPATGARALPLPLATVPVAFVEPDPTHAPSEADQAVLTQLQQDFVKAIGGPNQNPNDPVYLRRWQDAQWESDQRFKALFGTQAFLARERESNGAGDGAAVNQR